jgi:hypothetical protein
MSATSLKVVSTEPAAPQGRQNLVAALARREETLARYQAASASANKLHGLIAGEAVARAALAELVARSAAGAAAWANGATTELEIPTEEEMAAATAEIAKASRLAQAARAALPAINEQANAAARAHQAAVCDAITEIHFELRKEAQAIRTKQLEHEAAAAQCGEELISLVLAFAANLLPDDCRGTAVAAYRHFINPFVDPLRMRAEPRSMAPRPDLAAKYIEFAARLARGDPAATLA